MKIKPILPCPSIKEQVSFYEHLGFQTTYLTTRPYPYAVVTFGALELHFYGSKKTVPAENPQMCYVEVEDVNRIYEAFTTSLKQRTGKIPRAGIPRISKVKDLAEDRRFLITDMGGNTLIVGTPNAELGYQNFFRTIESEAYAQHFETLFDLLYSKEDSQAALRMLEKFFPADLAAIEVHPIDLAKIHLVALDIQLQLHNEVNPTVEAALKTMLANCDADDSKWKRIARQYADIVSGE